MNKEIKDCCTPTTKLAEKSGLFWGILYGLIPHTFCILFVVFSIIGATAGTTFLRRFLFIPNLFLYLIALSLVFACLSAVIYLKRLNALNLEGIKAKYKYLIILFSTTVAINLLFIYVIIPRTTNITSASTPGVAVNTGQSNSPAPKDAQVIYMDQLAGGYRPDTFTVKADMPVRWIINSKKDTCAASIYSPKLGIKVVLNPGENIIDFTAPKPGTYKFSCFMGMYSGTIIVEK